MYQDRMKNLKKTRKDFFKGNVEEKTAEKSNILTLAKFFNIPVDETRIEDYIIKRIEYINPSIEIKDERKNIVYTATHTSDANLLNYRGAKQFNSVISTSPIRKEESLYYIGSKIPIITKMTFSNGEYELTFEREVGNCVGFGLNAESKFAIRYNKNVSENNSQTKQQLLSKIFMNKNKNETFEQTYTYSLQHLIDYDDNQDKYCYIKNGNIIYGVNNCDVKKLLHYFQGICLESINQHVTSYLPFKIKTEVTELTNPAYKSGIVFKGGTGNGIHHIFTIFKTKNPSNIIEAAAIDCGIYLKYEATKWENFKKENGEPSCRRTVVAHKEAQFPIINSGNITSSEIINIIESLVTEFNDNMFIQFVINELRIFSSKIDIQKGIAQEEFDPLSPKLFIDKSFDEICALVSSNKDDYFKLIKEQFEKATHIKLISEKGQSRILKPIDSSDN